MKQICVAVLAVGLLAASGRTHAQTMAERSKGEVSAREQDWSIDDEPSGIRGYIGAIGGVGVGVNGQRGTGAIPSVDTSAIFALRGGLLLGEGNRWLFGFEVAPTTNRLDWRFLATATGFVSVGSLVSIKDSKDWAWLWKVGVGVGGGLEYRFLVGVQLDILTFNYKMSDRLWVDLGAPTLRFHIETGDRARYNAQFVFPLGITFAI